MTSIKPISIGLVASPAMRSGPRPTLITFLQAFEPFITQVLGAQLVAVGGTHDAIRHHGLFNEYPRLERLPNGSLGGVISLAARVVDPNPDRAVDWVIYLLDPTDPTSLYPEAQALKRQCVVHGKPFFATTASAAEWCNLEWAQAQETDAACAGGAAFVQAVADHVRPDSIANETIALIGHDALKGKLMEFVCRHHDLLSRFGRRLATGTTGTLLNGVLPARLGATTPAGPDFREMMANLLRSRMQVVVVPGLSLSIADRWEATPKSRRRCCPVTVGGSFFWRTPTSRASTRLTYSCSSVLRS